MPNVYSLDQARSRGLGEETKTLYSEVRNSFFQVGITIHHETRGTEPVLRTMNPISSFYSFSSFLCGTFPFDLSVIPILFLSHSVPGAENKRPRSPSSSYKRSGYTHVQPSHAAAAQPTVPVPDSLPFRSFTDKTQKKRNSHQMKKQESHNS